MCASGPVRPLNGTRGWFFSGQQRRCHVLPSSSICSWDSTSMSPVTSLWIQLQETSLQETPPPYCSHCASRVGHHLYLFPHVSPSFLAPEQKTRRLDSICISDWFIGLFFCRKIGIFFSPHANQIYPSKNMKKGRGQGRGNTSMALKEVHFFFLFFFYKRHRKTQNTHTNACMDQFVLVTSHPTRGETTHTDTMDRSRQFQHTADFTPHLLYLSKNPCLPPEVCRSSDA